MSNLTPWPDLWKSILALNPIILDGCELAPSEDGWVSIFCPIHTEQKPSLRVNIETGGIKCMAGCDVGSNLNDLEDLILDRANLARRGKRPKDVVGDLADLRLLPRDWLIDKFGIEPAPGGYSIPIDDPETDPDIKIDYEIDGLEKRIRHWIVKRGEWIDKDATTRPKYRWEPKLSTSGVKAKDLVYNLHRILPRLPNEKLVYICAGPPDVWVMVRAGFPAISFLAGEGNVPTPRAIDKLRQAGAEEAIIIYDRDEAGEEGSEKLARELSEAGISAVVRELPEDLGHGGDLSDLWRRCEGDGDAFEKALANTPTKVWPAEDVPAREVRHLTKREKYNLPEECWVEPFSLYREAVQRTTEACDEYHFFALMNVIGALLGRRVYVYYSKRLFANQYTCMLGASGIARKSTANRLAVETVVDTLYQKDQDRDKDRAEGEPLDVKKLDGTALTVEEATGSAEGMLEAIAFADADPADYDKIQAMLGWKKGKKGKAEEGADAEPLTEEDLYETQERRLLIRQDEFTKMLSKAQGGGGGSGLIPHLLTTFDCPKEIRLRTRKRPVLVVNPVVSILTDSTIDHLSQFFNELEWTSGFGNRFLFIDGEPKERIANPKPPNVGLMTRVVQHVYAAYTELSESEKHYNILFAMDEAAEMVWEECYNTWSDIREHGLGQDQVAATERVPDYALKFALIYAVLSADHECTISAEDVELGWKAARYAERVTHELVKNLIEEKMARWQERINAYIGENQPIKKRDLQRHFRRIPVTTLKLLLDNLEAMKVIQNVAKGYITVR